MSNEDISDLISSLQSFETCLGVSRESTTTDDYSTTDNLTSSENDADIKNSLIRSQLVHILAEEAKAMCLLQESVNRKEQLADELYALYDKTKGKHKEYVELERALSFQAGQLLSAMQQEEARAMEYSTAVRRVRQTRKQMLTKIKNPRWEIPHHYHMTCVEHAWGHEQAHVMDVGEMMPGHLRILAIARRSTLYQKAMIHSLERAKKQRNEAHEQIKGVYRQLREIRADIKQVDKLLDAIKKKSHIFPRKARTKTSSNQIRPKMAPRINSMYGHSNIRRKYLTSLQITPPSVFMTADHETKEGEVIRRKELSQAIDNEWKTVVEAVESEIKSEETRAAELETLRKSRKNLHIISLPSPSLAAYEGDDDNDENDVTTSPIKSSKATDYTQQK